MAEKLNQKHTTCLSDSESEWVLTFAREQGMTVSKLIRQQILRLKADKERRTLRLRLEQHHASQ